MSLQKPHFWRLLFYCNMQTETAFIVCNMRKESAFIVCNMQTETAFIVCNMQTETAFKQTVSIIVMKKFINSLMEA
jgi:hypothetical protein